MLRVEPPGSAASGGAAGSVLGLAAAASDVTFPPLVTDKLKAELRAQKLKVFSSTVHKRGTWSQFRKQIDNLNLRLQK